MLLSCDQGSKIRMQDIVNTLPKLIKTKKQETTGILKSRWHCMYHWGTPQLVTIKSVWTMFSLAAWGRPLQPLSLHTEGIFQLPKADFFLPLTALWVSRLTHASLGIGFRGNLQLLKRSTFYFITCLSLIFIQILLELLIGKHLSSLLTSSTCHLWKSLSSLYFYYKQLHQLSWHL